MFVAALTVMEIVWGAETCAIDLENSSKETDAECLRQKISYIFNRNLNINLRTICPNHQERCYCK